MQCSINDASLINVWPKLREHIGAIELYESQMVNSIELSESTRKGIATSNVLNVAKVFATAAAPSKANMQP